LAERHGNPAYQTVQLGRAILSVPVDVDLKPYIKNLLSIELEAIQHPVAREAIVRGLEEASTNEDMASLLETFHLLSSAPNAERLIAALERAKTQEEAAQSIEDSNIVYTDRIKFLQARFHYDR
jgi:hypothetical protein